MSSWFPIDPNKFKQIAASTLINAQKKIDQVLDIKEDSATAQIQPITADAPVTTSVNRLNEDFFSSFLGTSAPTPTTTEQNETQTKATESNSSLTNWNSWGDQALLTTNTEIVEQPSDAEVTTKTEEEKPIATDSIQVSETVDSSSITDSMMSQNQGRSSVSLAESSTITESSSSDSTQSIQAAGSSIPSSASTIIDPNAEHTIHEGNKSDEAIENSSSSANRDDRSDPVLSLPSDKRNVIDSWMNNGETSMVESSAEPFSQALDESNTSSALYLSSYPPDEFSNHSILIDGELNSTSVIEDKMTQSEDEENQQSRPPVSSTDEEENVTAAQSESPTHTVSSSNGLETNSKGSSDDGKHTSCASSDIEVISSPSVTSGIALTTAETFDKCRELRDARRPIVREVVGRFPSHPANLKYHQHPLPLDGINKNPQSHFDAPLWSTLIDEAATEQNSYQQQPDENENDHYQISTEHETTDIEKEVLELKERLESRELALKKLTDESNDLHRTNQSLKQSLAELEQKTSRLTSEFQQTIENLSMKLEEQKQIVQERDHLRKQLTTVQKQLFENSTSSGNTMAVIREKEEQIQQLLEEGEKLSKAQLQHTNIIKKLRAKEKDNEAQISSLNGRIEKLTNDLEEAKKSNQEKEENEKQLKESVKKFEKAAVHYEKECLSLKSLYEDAEEQVRSTKVALENSYKEIAELNKTKAATESKVAEATLSAEVLLREEIRLAVEKERLISRQEQEKLQLIIDELRHSIQQNETKTNRKEQLLRQEINDLRQALQDAESRNGELTQNISNATRPLLRQIENLQTTYVSQINSLEKTERQLTDRLAEMQAHYATSVEHERVAQESLLEINAKWKSAEAQLATLRQDKVRLTSELEIFKMKLTNLEESRLREKTQVDSMQEAFTQQINTLIQEKRQLELDAEMEKSKYESDLKRLQIVNETMREQHELTDARSISRTNSNLESTISLQRSRRSSGGGHEPSNSFSFERSAFVLTPKPSVYETLRNTGAIAVLESLESQLKEKEGEITLLQSEIADLERTRESMARELVNLSNANEKLQQQTQNFPILQEKFQALEKRYDALLTMYGEKQEEADELRMDLADVKTLYRAQIDDLTKQKSQNR